MARNRRERLQRQPLRKVKTIAVAFEDDYKNQTETKTGNLQLTKTIKGDITEEEAEGALTFEVTTADGKWLDKDGKLSDSEVVLTLKDFAHEEGTKEYTLSFEGIRIGDYTVKETTKDIDGKDVAVSYTVDNGQKQTGPSAEATVKEGKTIAVAFEDDYKNQTETKTGNLQLKKTILGDITEEEAEGALTFEVKTADGRYLDKDGNLSDTEVKLTLKDFAHEEGTKEYTLSFEGIQIGDYTVEETTKDIDGKDVAVSYTVDNGQKQTGPSAEATVKEGKTIAVAFEDDYKNQTETKTGNLQLTKTIQGDITEEEAEGALTFEVKTADGKWLDKDGNISDSEVVLTLKDFDHEDGTKEYTLSFEGIQIGDYTVTETTKTIDGKDVAVSYTVDNGQKQTGTSAEATVSKGETVTVAFEDDYKNQTETKTGNLQLTKTIKGDITEEEAEGALTFEVTTADDKWLKADGSLSDTKVELTLKDFAHEEGTKEYTLSFEGIQIGEYTVKETTKDIDGKDVTVSYQLNDGEAKEGAEASATVETNETTTVAFEDNYKEKQEAPEQKVTFLVNKVSTGAGNEIEGATLVLMEKESGKIVDKWASEKDKLHNFGDAMEVDTKYILKETIAPRGYLKIRTDIEVSVDADGKVTAKLGEAEDEDGNTVYLVEDAPIIASIQLINEESNPLKQGTITLRDEEGEPITSWLSDGEPHDIGPYLEVGGEYTVTEDNPPDGYNGAEDIHVTVTEDGTVTVDGNEVTDNEIIIQNIPDSEEKVTAGEDKNKEKDKDTNKENNKKKDKKTSESNKNSKSASQPAKDHSAGTGDETPLTMFLLLFLASITGIGSVIVLNLRRRQMR